jgi:hypothetical protein
MSTKEDSSGRERKRVPDCAQTFGQERCACRYKLSKFKDLKVLKFNIRKVSNVIELYFTLNV